MRADTQLEGRKSPIVDAGIVLGDGGKKGRRLAKNMLCMQISFSGRQHREESNVWEPEYLHHIDKVKCYPS